MTDIAEYFTTYRSYPEPPLVLGTLFSAVRQTLDEAGCFPLTVKHMYDAGCGSGGWLAHFLAWGAQPHRLTGVDLTPDRIERARRTLPPAVALRVGDAAVSCLPSASQDIVSAFVVFSTILDPAVRQRLADELLRVKKPNGVILWYDLRVNNPRNPHIRRVGADEIRTLFRGHSVQLTSTTLTPPIARRVARHERLYRALSRVPLLHSHYLGIVR
jgi:SAM-dependent methyltransferase